MSLQQPKHHQFTPFAIGLCLAIIANAQNPQAPQSIDEPVIVELHSDERPTEISEKQPPSTPAQPANKVTPDNRSYTCFQLPALTRQGMLRIDGKITDPAWDLAPWSDDFIDIEGPAKPRPRFRTRMKMLWDSNSLYIAAELQEPNVTGTISTRDSVVFHDNDFEVFIDPNGDQLNYGELELNALNTVWDLRLPRTYSAGGQPDDGWTLHGLQTAVWVDGSLNQPASPDNGWTLEIAIPWNSLASLHLPNQPVRRALREGSLLRGYEIVPNETTNSSDQPATVTMPPAPGDIWRMNFSRVQWPEDSRDEHGKRLPGIREDNWVWSPQGVVDMHRPETWGRITFAGPPEIKPTGYAPARIIRR